MISYSSILVKKYQGSEWSIKDDSDYLTLEWFSENTKKPTKEELDTLWDTEVKTLVQNDINRVMRKHMYESETDALFFAYQRGECTQEDWLSAIENIKKKFPIIKS